MKRFKNKASKYGYYFGLKLRNIGATLTLFFLILIPNEETYVNKKMILPMIICATISYYGLWRTGGIHYEKK